MLARVTQGEDFYSLSGCRDLLFHVQEHRFTLPQLAVLLAGLGLSFLGFELSDTAIAARYRIDVREGEGNEYHPPADISLPP